MNYLPNISAMVLLVLLSCFTITASAVPARAAVADIRVLIDISGSMKHNDPANLRTPALKLLVGLLPEKTRSGIWMFGQYVNMQVKLDTVSREWKQLARKAADTIHSRGLYTNIEDAIRRASTGWTTDDPAFNRNLILLTDGMVDISRDDALDNESRQRILTELLPRLRKAGVSIHTIALSDNADQELLKTLSLSTGGWFEKVQDADKLQRVFLRLFEKSAQSDALPLKQNRFSVDNSITDMTLLVFQSDTKTTTRITGPENINWTEKNHPQQVQWFHEKDYDLISIPRPPKGDWIIDAPVDDDNRVMVVTNLRLNVNTLPAHVLLGNGVNVSASLSEDGKTINRPDFLKLIQFTTDQTNADNTPVTVPLHDNGVEPDANADDGIFAAAMPRAMSSGDLELVINANSATFSRQWRHQIKVYESAVKIDLLERVEQADYLLTIKPEPGLLQPESIKITTLLAGNVLQLVANDKNKNWQISIPAPETDQQLDILVRGMDYTNKLYEAHIQRTLVASSSASQADKSQVAGKLKQEPDSAANDPAPLEPVSKDKADSPQAVKRDEITPGVQGKSSSRKWWLVSILVICINLLLGGGGYLLWGKIRARKDDFDRNIENELEDGAAEILGDMSMAEDMESEQTATKAEAITEQSDDVEQPDDAPTTEQQAEEVQAEEVQAEEVQAEEANAKEEHAEEEHAEQPETEIEEQPGQMVPPGLPDVAALDKFLDSHKDMLTDPGDDIEAIDTDHVPDVTDEPTPDETEQHDIDQQPAVQESDTEAESDDFQSQETSKTEPGLEPVSNVESQSPAQEQQADDQSSVLEAGQTDEDNNNGSVETQPTSAAEATGGKQKES